MTSAEALARVRTLLDEASAGFWTDNEIYSALTDGQNEVITIKLNEFRVKSKFDLNTPLPDSLRALVTSTTGTGTTSLAADYLHYVNVYTSTTPVYVRDFNFNRSHSSMNTYLASSSSTPYCYFNATQIVFETSVSWTLDYLKQPADIASGANPPTLEDKAMNAVIQYAFALLLKKDKDPRADGEFAIFLQLVKNLY